MSDETDTERTSCLIQDALDRVEACPGQACPFWESGGPALPGGCAVARLGLPTSLDLRQRPDLAAWLLEIRRSLESGGSPSAECASLFGLSHASSS
jgi:hypothetical protein